MALEVNAAFPFAKPQAYVDYASTALIPAYRGLALGEVVSAKPCMFKTGDGEYSADSGTLVVRENRSEPDS